MWGTLLLSAFILLLIWDYFNKKHRNEILRKSNIYGGFTLPLIGGALRMVGANSENIIDRLRLFVKENGKVFHTWVLHQLVVFCADPKILESLLSSPVHITKNNVYDMLSLWLGDGLLMSTGKKWHTRRKIITPSFHFKILEEFVDIFDRQTKVMIKQLNAKVKDENTPIDMFPVVCLTALDIIAETAMGVQVNAQSDPNIGYVQSVKIVTEIISTRLRKPHWRTDGMFKLFAPHVYQNMIKHINLMQNFTKDVIEKRRDALESILKNSDSQKSKETEEDLDIGVKKHMALLDILLQATVDGKPLSNEDIREEVETFMFEGHDTTTSGTSFALYVISRHPEVQKKLFDEIREVIGDDKEQAASYRQLQNLRYMDCVLKESMRLYPPVPIIGRYFKEDTDLNGFLIPGDCHLNVPLFVVLRDPDYFKDPNDFKPERFSSENAEDIYPFAYTPFSAGPRNCIGQKYAMLEMKSVISKILRHYELLPIGPEVVPLLSLILRSKTEILIVFITLLLLWDYLSKKRRNDMLSYMPGPKTLPILGNVLMYRGQSPEEIMEFITNNKQKFGKLYRVWILQQLAVFSSDPDDVEVILSSPQTITKNNLYELLHQWLGTGLLMSTGKKWHSRRKIITPTFHFKILEQFVEIFDQQSAVMVKKLYDKADGKTAINIFPIICLTALDIIAETAMGVKINAQKNPDFPYVQAVTAVTNITARRFVNVWHRINWIFRLTAAEDYKRLNDSIKLMHDFTENIIMERRKTLEETLQKNSHIPDVNEFGQKKRMALLDVLLQSNVDGVPLSNEDIREEVDTFMFEGHDTTTSGISFALYLISRHPEVQQKIFEEIVEVIGSDKERPVTLRDLGELKYLECVIKESLRLYPPVPLIGRYFTEDVVIRGKKIPAGTNYTVGIYITLRDPLYFPDPDAFKPERFLDESINKINPYAYIPFSAGPRNCIGQKFAILEMKSTISKILRHFELLPLGPEVRPMMNLILRSANGNHMVLICIADVLARNHATRNLINIPLVSKLPIVGSILIISTITPDNFHIKWPQYVRRFGKTFAARIMGYLSVVTVDHRIVEVVLSSQEHLEKHFLYQLLSVWLGNGLLLSSGKVWHKMRKIITPTFHFKILEQFIEVFDGQTDIFVEKLKTVADGQRILNIYDYVGLLTMDIIAETAMGVKINAQMDSKSDVVKAIIEVTDIMSIRFIRPQYAYIPTLRLFSPKTYHSQEKNIKILHDFTEKIIAERQKSLLKDQDQNKGLELNDDPQDLGLKKRMALLDVLLQSTVEGETLTDKQIRDEVNTFMFEGHDTTTSATSFCLYALSRHPEVQQKLFLELRAYFGDQLKHNITYKDLQELNYLNCVIKESLRLYPPILAIGRILKNDLKVDKYSIPANANIIILLWEILRDPTVFEDPLRFLPERHQMNNDRVNAFSNIPFSAGPRNCIGQKFAQLEMRTILIKVIRNFELLPLGEEVQPTMSIILRSKSGVNLGLRPRNYGEPKE
ncbi:Cytochrome P450 4d2 [Lucilia cuprina]|nr:Cytochrome P450 4d2 [Lucilia cuprina]